MKKFFSLIAASALLVGALTGCAGTPVVYYTECSCTNEVHNQTQGSVETETNTVPTKNQKGADYGMVAWGGAKYEWFEQAASFASYVTGKTAAEVAGIAVNEKTAPTEADLAATVTIAIGNYMALIDKALK